MSEQHEGGCLCGATRYVFSGAPRFAIRCYCRDCQRVSGGGHAPQIAVGRDGLTVTGALKIHRRTAESGSDLEFGFCGECGSPLTKSTSRAPEIAFLYVGSLDNPAIVAEFKPVFEAARQPWDQG
ncbi:hypothetical protein DEA8626_03501 [Defluviimonas aquaemixtae]|uniref:CENP-V/GFA domain-containing protein n=1 Tax=Albidovulum aquaemixtae TaxID=1542388 RepID=A0A2R8BM13_9RHOB|nr:GFA family protein [Defluviimonas aquaemixtae]SPH24449.1 hypothetical protein DEA8626_03501 [Defluviimonas aquaemixtae]